MQTSLIYINVVGANKMGCIFSISKLVNFDSLFIFWTDATKKIGEDERAPYFFLHLNFISYFSISKSEFQVYFLAYLLYAISN